MSPSLRRLAEYNAWSEGVSPSLSRLAEYNAWSEGMSPSLSRLAEYNAWSEGMSPSPRMHNQGQHLALQMEQLYLTQSYFQNAANQI